MEIDKIEDNGKKFIIHSTETAFSELKNKFDNLGLGISVTQSERGKANILYTENNRDIVLRILKEQTT